MWRNVGGVACAVASWCVVVVWLEVLPLRRRGEPAGCASRSQSASIIQPATIPSHSAAASLSWGIHLPAGEGDGIVAGCLFNCGRGTARLFACVHRHATAAAENAREHPPQVRRPTDLHERERSTVKSGTNRWIVDTMISLKTAETRETPHTWSEHVQHLGVRCCARVPHGFKGWESDGSRHR